MVVIKECAWCKAEMQTTRSSKKLCSSKCHVAFHRWRQKALPGAGPAQGFELLKQQQVKENESIG